MSTSVFASEEGIVNTEGYFEFITKTGPTPRIESDGSFVFEFSDILSSQDFKLSSTSTLIRAKATCEDPNYTYYITVVETYGGGITKMIPFKADGKWHSHTFTGLKTDTYYYLDFDNGAWGDGKTVTGEGTISNYVS